MGDAQAKAEVHHEKLKGHWVKEGMSRGRWKALASHYFSLVQNRQWKATGQPRGSLILKVGLTRYDMLSGTPTPLIKR